VTVASLARPEAGLTSQARERGNGPVGAVRAHVRPKSSERTSFTSSTPSSSAAAFPSLCSAGRRMALVFSWSGGGKPVSRPCAGCAKPTPCIESPSCRGTRPQSWPTATAPWQIWQRLSWEIYCSFGSGDQIVPDRVTVGSDRFLEYPSEQTALTYLCERNDSTNRHFDQSTFMCVPDRSTSNRAFARRNLPRNHGL
jgi:hypothetical protein